MKYSLHIICFSIFFLSKASFAQNSNIELIEKQKRQLVAAYPQHLKTVEGNFIVWNDGTKMAFSDGIEKKSFDEMLLNACLKDQMLQTYPKGEMSAPPAENEDAGRMRDETFFKKMYGTTKADVQKNLVAIDWLPNKAKQKIWVTKVNNVDKKLMAISAELEKLPDEFLQYVKNPAGTFYWRYISGTKRLSFHSFGAAIDINTHFSHYWVWTKPDAKGKYAYKNKIPIEIVLIFEKYGFIWGGKWYHYDTMHFEYRPELLIE